MSSRRTFIKNVSAIGLGSQLIGDCLSIIDDFSSWEEVARLFFKDEMGRLNFNTGSAGMMPIPVYNKYLELTKVLSSYAAYEVKEAAEPIIADSMSRLSGIMGCSDQKIALVRNTTEGINSILHGYPFHKDDEVLISSMAYQYPHYTLDKLEQRAGIKKVLVQLEPTVDSDEEIVRKFEASITDKTKLILITYMTHREGQIQPVKAICKMAHAKGIEVIVDAAHALGQYDHSIRDLDCDYYISSLHKWMYAPLGTGVIYIREAMIDKINSDYSYPKKLSDSMKKFNYTGTIAFQNAISLPAILDFHEAIGIHKKEARLRELATYLKNSIKDLKYIQLRNDDTRSCGIVAFAVEPMNYKVVKEKYLTDHGIHVKTTNYKKVPFIRVTVNLHLTEKDIDYFTEATKAIVSAE